MNAARADTAAAGARTSALGSIAQCLFLPPDEPFATTFYHRPLPSSPLFCPAELLATTAALRLSAPDFVARTAALFAIPSSTGELPSCLSKTAVRFSLRGWKGVARIAEFVVRSDAVVTSIADAIVWIDAVLAWTVAVVVWIAAGLMGTAFPLALIAPGLPCSSAILVCSTAVVFCRDDFLVRPSPAVATSDEAVTFTFCAVEAR